MEGASVSRHNVFAALLVSSAVACASSGCGSQEDIALRGTEDGGHGAEGPALKPGAPADKVDLLFMIDNSLSMGDKQEILRLTVPDLVRRLVNPVCVNPNMPGVQREPPADVDAPCPDDGFTRELAPVQDLHIGIISSSLGSYGSTDACVPNPTNPRPELDEQLNDNGRMIGARPRALSLGLARVAEGTPGFLEWFARANEPAPSIDDLSDRFQSLVSVVGENGCGYEASLEAWYRFLVDPSPPERFEVYPCFEGGSTQCTRALGRDEALMAQRSAFLRSDSLLAIVMLTDENDCSIQASGQGYYAARLISLPPATPVCATNPNDPCCYSCQLPVPEACPIKEKPPECSAGSTVPLEQDHPNLRCWEQKRRFGVDFLFPVERYVNALVQRDLCTRTPSLDPASAACRGEDLARNPLYQDLSGAGGATRGLDRIFLAGIVGVPWEDIQADVDEKGNRHPDGELHYLTAAQMLQRDTWSMILGEPEPGFGAAPLRPLDPLMMESVEPRSGVTPSTGEALQPPSAGYMAHSINGHEWDVGAGGSGDLQYACIFPLPEGRDCAGADPALQGCDCTGDPGPAVLRKPVCQAPDGSYSTVQRFAKAYPGLRLLHVLRDFGGNSIVASICPRNTSDPSRQDFAYRPALSAIVARIKKMLLGA
jgi:hypothetical protein